MGFDGRARVTRAELGPGGERIEDEMDGRVAGALVYTGNLGVADTAVLEQQMVAAVNASPALIERRKSVEMTHLYLVVRGDLDCETCLRIGTTAVGCLVLVVHGDLSANGVYLDSDNYLSITGDMKTPYLYVHGSDGATVWCAGKASLDDFIHDQDGHEIAFDGEPRHHRTDSDEARSLIGK